MHRITPRLTVAVGIMFAGALLAACSTSTGTTSKPQAAPSEFSAANVDPGPGIEQGMVLAMEHDPAQPGDPFKCRLKIKKDGTAQAQWLKVSESTADTPKHNPWAPTGGVCAPLYDQSKWSWTLPPNPPEGYKLLKDGRVITGYTSETKIGHVDTNVGQAGGCEITYTATRPGLEKKNWVQRDYNTQKECADIQKAGQPGPTRFQWVLYGYADTGARAPA